MAEESSGLGRQLSVNEGKKDENERKQEEEESDEKKSKDVEAQNNSDGDDGDEEEELPFPGFSPKSFFILKQTNMLRYVCLRTITNPYPFINNIVRHFGIIFPISFRSYMDIMCSI